MSTPTIDLDAYLRRIGHDGPCRADAPTLAALIAAHAAAIPFENLEVLAGRVPALQPQALQRKLVDGGRGGYCFEQNSLMLDVLRQIGFDVRPLEARVRANVPPDVVTARTHMALEVTLDGARWLADVGFGGLAPLAPVAFGGQATRCPDGAVYRLLERAGTTALQLHTDHGWEDCYHLGRESPQSVDLQVGNWYVATHPEAMLGRNLLVARAVDGGRLTLFNRRLTFRRASTATLHEEDLASEAHVAAVLAQRFGLVLDAADLERALARLPGPA
ncbi:MAG TPA: arylamine N-acetyltransferase [Burkholderiaceae bacterium]|nr:arylamine N-acetyltransferase [Burkholderiaceae bacterium]